MENKMKFDPKVLSMLGQNGAIFGSAVCHYHDEYKLKVLTSDMAYGAGLSRYKTKYPKDFYDVGIAEQNLLGITAGLASEGYKCIATAQSCFLSMRSFEQVRQYMGYMQFPAILIGINSGFSLTYFGNSHYALEDLGLMRLIPNLVVLSPADAGEAVKAFETALELNEPVYIRLSGTLNNPIVYKEDFAYDYRTANVIYNKGEDAVILATGTMVAQSIKVADSLAREGINVTIIDVHCLNPIYEETIIAAVTNTPLVVTVEEHFVTGGIGAAVSDIMVKSGISKKLLKIGVADHFSEVGDYNYLLDINGLSVEKIVTAIKKNLR